jgi:Leucine-rich repeat (LRR) protein
MLDQAQAALYARDPLLLVGLHDVTREALDLSDCGLSVLPQQVLALTGLTKLDLSRNAIQVPMSMS